MVSDSEVTGQELFLPVSGKKPPYTEKFINHLGLVVLLPVIAELTEKLSAGKDICCQILSQFLLGALNVEQSKTVSKNFFNLFLVADALKIQALRTAVHYFSSLDLRMELAYANIRKFCDYNKKIFYYDPHTKKYTGMLKILAGYCGSLHQTGKVLISDYIHTIEGKPCFVEHFDNMYDLRIRFHFTVKAFKKLYPAEMRRGFTWIIDRAIYGLNAMDDIVKSGDHIITWEKDYKKDAWNSKLNPETFVLRLTRNNSYDIKEYFCEFQELKWQRNSEFRRFIVRVTKKIAGKKKRTIEVSVLCSNPDISAQEAITYILRRWLQENDFAYLIKHYGIDQIDSYKFNEYRNLKDKEKGNDFLVKSREFKKLERDKTALKTQYKKALDNRERKLDSFDRKLKKRLNDRKEKFIAFASELTDEKEAASTKSSQRKLNSAIRKMKRHQDKTHEINHSEKLKREELKMLLNKEILDFKSDISELEYKIKNTVKDESRLNALIDEKYCRIDTAAKSVLDILRIQARNAFYEILETDFRPLYDNLRDDHVILRTLIKAPGRIRTLNGVLMIELFPEADFQEKAINAVKTFIALRESKINKFFQGKAMPISLTVNL